MGIKNSLALTATCGLRAAASRKNHANNAKKSPRAQCRGLLSFGVLLRHPCAEACSHRCAGIPEQRRQSDGLAGRAAFACHPVLVCPRRHAKPPRGLAPADAHVRLPGAQVSWGHATEMPAASRCAARSIALILCDGYAHLRVRINTARYGNHQPHVINVELRLIVQRE